MAVAHSGLDNHRELLAQAIVNELQSWPEPYRDLFVQVHYRGCSVLDAAHSMGLDIHHVNGILVECELKLRAAVAVFRNTQPESLPDCSHHFSQFMLVG